MVFSYSSIVNCMGQIDCCKMGARRRLDKTLASPSGTCNQMALRLSGQLFLRLTGHHGTINLKAPGLRDDFMEAKVSSRILG